MNSTLKNSLLVAGCIGVLVLMAIFMIEISNKPAPSSELTESPNGRINVSRIGTFRDGLAYESKRGIYIIKDNQTGKEYIGISGVGISETGSHRTGKSYVTTDER